MNNYDDHGAAEAAKDERIATLESQLAEAERTIAELRGHSCGKTHGYQTGECVFCSREGLRRERDEAKRVAVFVAEQRITLGVGFDGRAFAYIPWRGGKLEHDGTDADIYRALKEAMSCK